MYQATGTVDGENLSEIAIHNFEKNRKIESAVGPNREKKRNVVRTYFYYNGVGDRDSSTLCVFGVGVAPL